ncbi:MAG: TonB-dependent receptor plug domain-containing protein [Bacteroidota bacterium]|nr:TonB-dependent receptor plug domain-containing protein [Bacteroidota bacterium]
MKNFAIVILLFFGTIVLQAQDSIKTKVLDSIVVRAKKIDLLENTPVGDALQKKDLQTIGVESVGEAAKFLSGVMVKDYGGLGGVKTVSVRGLSSNHTAILYDGINIFDNQSGQVDLGKYSLANVGGLYLANAQFTPLLPTASALASASTINIQTEKPNLEDNNMRSEIGLSYGSFSTFGENIFFARKINNKNIITTYFDLTHSKGNYPFVLHYGLQDNQKTQKLRRDNNEIFSTHTELNWFWDISKSKTLKLKTYYYYSDRELPSAVTLYYMNSKEELYNKNLFLQSTFTSYLNGLFTYKNNFKIDWNYTHYLNPLLSNGLQGENDIYKLLLLYDNNAISFQPTENLFFTLTNDIYYNRLKANTQMDSEPERFSSLSAFVVDWRLFKKLYLTTNILHSLYYDMYSNSTNTTQHFSPYFCLKWQDNNFTSSLFYKNIFRMPTFNELYYRRFGSKDLNPENTMQLSITNSFSKVFKESELSIEVSLYYNDVTNKIVAIPKNIYLWSMVNYGKVKIYGCDFKLGANTRIEDFIIEGKLNYSFSRATDNEPSSLTYKDNLPYSPEQVYSIIANLSYKNIVLGYNCMLVDNRYSLPENITYNLLPHYADHSANINYSYKTKDCNYKFTFSLNNIFNKQYEVIRSYPMMGRNCQIKITLSL